MILLLAAVKMIVKTEKLKYFSLGKFFCSDEYMQFMDQCLLPNVH